MGRWMSPDPYNCYMDINYPQTFNRYAYVNNRPLNMVDPLGLSGCDHGEPCPISGAGNGGTWLVDLGQFLCDILCWGGHASFNGKVAPNDGRPPNKVVYSTTGIYQTNGIYTMTVNVTEYQSLAQTVPIALPQPIPWAQIGAEVLAIAREIPPVAASVLLLNMQGDNSMSQACKR